jgi:hypothetical protein
MERWSRLATVSSGTRSIRMAHMTKDPVSPQSSSFEAYLAKPEMRLLVACCRVVLEVAGDGELNEALARRDSSSRKKPPGWNAGTR